MADTEASPYIPSSKGFTRYSSAKTKDLAADVTKLLSQYDVMLQPHIRIVEKIVCWGTQSIMPFAPTSSRMAWRELGELGLYHSGLI
ncbi:MAG: hypothetical protein ABI363_06690 [Nitrosospira sp.]